MNKAVNEAAASEIKARQETNGKESTEPLPLLHTHVYMYTGCRFCTCTQMLSAPKKSKYTTYPSTTTPTDRDETGQDKLKIIL